jgi:SAM-dependent methyltransferase
VTEETLETRLARLAKERVEADRRYNDALTALDALKAPATAAPAAAPPYDDAKLADINAAWNILPSGAPPIDGSLKGRLRAMIWRIAGPPLEAQKHFNAAIVDHLNRNVASHRETAAAIAAASDALREQAAWSAHLHALLVQFLQTVTLYVDTRDRAVGGQVHLLNQAIHGLTDDWLKRWESLSAKEVRWQDRLATIDDVRATSVLAQQTALTLKREVERLLQSSEMTRTTGPAGSEGSAGSAGSSVRPDLDSFKYLGFEDAFRGSRDEIRRRLATYVPEFQGLSPVLDLGCGRGEFLDLLHAAGIEGRGLDVNHEMVEACRARGLDVAEGDALSYVAALPDASLGGIFAAQVVEHLEPDYLIRLLETARHKIRPGGAIVLETINAACWTAFFESYLRDLTHVRALHPDTLQYLLRASGFNGVTVAYASPVAEWDKLRATPAPDDAPAGVSDLVEAFNENVRRLNDRLFTYQDYAAIGHV